MRASPPAHALGLVRDGRLVHAAVRDMVAEVRRDGVISKEDRRQGGKERWRRDRDHDDDKDGAKQEQ